MGGPAANEVDDFDLVARPHHCGIERLSFQDDEVVLDRHAARIDLEAGEQIRNGHDIGNLERIPVDLNSHFFAILSY